MDKNFQIYVSIEGISSFTRKMEKIYGVEKDEGELVRLLLATTKSGGKIKILQAFINCLSAFFKEITSACESKHGGRNGLRNQQNKVE